MKKAKWIWKYGDFELYHNMLLHSRRQELGMDFPPMWKVDSPSCWVEFKREFCCEKAGYLKFSVCGIGLMDLDGVRIAENTKTEIKEGKHFILLRVMNTSGLPCAYVQSDVCPSGEDWYTELPVFSLEKETEKQPVGCTPEYTEHEITPENFNFLYKRIKPIAKETLNGGMLFDFGHEIFGKLYLDNTNKKPLGVYYGESREEALDTQYSILSEIVEGEESYTLRSRAFRYVFICGDLSHEFSVYCDYEYLPLSDKGSFLCDDRLINNIWNVSAHTFHLNSREFYLDGIKRDRWVWSGDAYQSYMINNYLYFDKEITRRTIIALRGRDTVTEHINTITDYSFYWIISVMNYYNSYGDKEFLKYIYPKMESLMKFCETRKNKDGFIEGADKDWVFIDWSDMDKTGAICAEQILFYASYKALYQASEIIGARGSGYNEKAESLLAKINKYYWNSDKGAFIDSYTSGRNNVTRHANIFAIMFDFADESQKTSIIENVLLNDSITQITTPYFKFYELDVLCRIGRLSYVTDAIRDYWGGMIKLGATSIWEEYVPGLSGAEHYEMYGNKYGKSLCHAWGAGPVYLFGRYYLGVYPTSVAYKTFEVSPALGGLKHIKGSVPVNGGTVSIELTENFITVETDVSGGTLIWQGKSYELIPNKTLKLISDASAVPIK